MPATTELAVASPYPAPAWAERLAESRARIRAMANAVHRSDDDWIPDAEAVLWGLFDPAVEVANTIFERVGMPERIERRGVQLVTTGVESQRRINVHVTLRSAGGRASGGAVLTTNVTHAVIYLVPCCIGAGIAWSLLTTGAPFTTESVHDLILAVFGDDPEATQHISPWFNLD